MSAAVKKYQRIAQTVDAVEYTGKPESRAKVIAWVLRHQGFALPASELHWRQDMATYWHPEHGFIYLPQGARRPGGALEPLRDDEIVVRTNAGIYVLVFPGDYVIRDRSGFYPLASESFHQCHVPNSSRRGTNPLLRPAF